MARNWASSLNGPITSDPLYSNDDYLASRRPVPRIRPEGAYIAEAHRGCLDILFKMQALTTGGGELDRPRYRKTNQKSSSEPSSKMDDQRKPTFIGVTRPAHPMPAAHPKRISTSGPAPSSFNPSESRPRPEDNSVASINADVRLIKTELESLKRRVHANSKNQSGSRESSTNTDFNSRQQDKAKYRSNDNYGNPQQQQGIVKFRPGPAYDSSRHDTYRHRPGTAYGNSRQDIDRYQPNSSLRTSHQDTYRYRPDTAYGGSRRDGSRYPPDVDYDDYADAVDSIDEQWDKAPRDWIERTRRRREMEEEVTYRRANGHTETYHRQMRNGRPTHGNSERPRVTFIADSVEDNRGRGGQKTYRKSPPPTPPPMAPNDDPDRPDGYRRVPDDERRQMLSLLMRAEEDIRGRYVRLPVILDTYKSREHKRELEEALDELQSAIAVYAQKKVYIKSDDRQ